MRSSVHIDNKNKDILILSEGSTQGLDDAALRNCCFHYIVDLYKSFIWYINLLIMTFFPMLPSVNKNSEQESDPMS